MNASSLNAYGLLMIAGIVVSAAIWGRFTKRSEGHDGRLTLIYFAGLLGAFIGAKIAFLFAEGWHYRHDWLALLTGRSITGGLLGGYVAVEIAKKAMNYRPTTGDLFAIVIPVGLILGRIGCLLQGCCPGAACDAAHWWTMTDAHGIPRWPAAAAELIFNAAFLAWALIAAHRHWMPGNRFHIYLIAYGVFRFAHEFIRDDQTWIGPIGGYHVIALALTTVGVLRFVARRRLNALPAEHEQQAAVSGIAPT